jgi:hypothetical protein
LAICLILSSGFFEKALPPAQIAIAGNNLHDPSRRF